ncbi:hypothetical protein BDZ88DRAFT_408239 [Geranomyces variabilis]|nr:hypothetical protein BDZ88DRAFT_408239 [Geranomyces variabilis]
MSAMAEDHSQQEQQQQFLFLVDAQQQQQQRQQENYHQQQQQHRHQQQDNHHHQQQQQQQQHDRQEQQIFESDSFFLDALEAPHSDTLPDTSHSHQQQLQEQQQQHQQQQPHQHHQRHPSQQNDLHQWALPLAAQSEHHSALTTSLTSSPDQQSDPNHSAIHSTGLMDMVTTSDGNAAVEHILANPAFTQFRQSSLEYDALISPYMTGEMTSLMQQDELDLLLTPLISPAMTPGVDFQHLSLSQMNETFSPLSSPALRPQDMVDYSNSYFSPAIVASTGGDNYTSSHSGPSVPSSYTSSPAMHPSAANHANLGMLDQSPALGPAQMQLRTSLVGVSPALQPALDSWSLPSAAIPAPRRRESLQSPLLSALREKGKKVPLSSPYTVPRKKSLALISPALMPLPSGRRRSSKSPDAVSGTNASDAGLQTPPSTLESGPVFKEPYPIQTKARQQNETPAFQPLAAADLLTSPALTPQLGPQAVAAVAAAAAAVAANGRLSLAPITPAQLMQLDNAQLSPEDPSPTLPTPAPSSHSLISPSLKPLLPSGSGKNRDAAIRLTEKSNYQNMREGNTDTIGLKYDGDVTTTVEAKRDCHKQAEQRRRDSLKQCFEDLRTLLPPIEEKNPSKVQVLKKSCQYIQYLQTREKDTNALLEKLRADLAARK